MTAREPLCFVWHMDAQGCFSVASEEFRSFISAAAAQALGRTWDELSGEFALDPADEVARAIARRDSWSGIAVSWPARDGARRLAVEMSGLPIFDAQGNFAGYRGFALCRGFDGSPDGDRARPAPTAAEPPGPTERPSLRLVRPVKNVVPFRAAAPAEAKPPILSAVERHAFSELARRLSARLNGAPEPETMDDRGVDAAGEESVSPPPHDALSPSEQEGEAPPSLPFDLDAQSLLDDLPVGLLIYRIDTPLYANRAFLDRTGHATLADFADAGGLDNLYVTPGAAAAPQPSAGRSLTITIRGDGATLDARLLSYPSGEATLHVLVLFDRPPDQGSIHASPLRAAAASVDREGAAPPAGAAEATRAEERAQRGASGATELVAAVAADMRARLNSIAEFSEMMLEERYGPIGNERYRARLNDIRLSAKQTVALVGDMLAAFRSKPSSASANLNEVVRRCVAEMQSQSNRQRILIRAALAPALPAITADAPSVGRIVHNLLATALKLADPGGQIVVSTAVRDASHVALRLRGTGRTPRGKMAAAASAMQLDAATAAARDIQLAEIGFSIAAALADANGATMSVASSAADGTLVEVTFPTAAPLA